MIHTLYEITSMSQTFGPLMYHKSLAYYDGHTKQVLHLTFDGVEKLTYKEFNENRKILSEKEIELQQPADIDTILYTHKDDKFNPIFNNCEHFTQTIIDECNNKNTWHISYQVVFWTIFVILMIIKLNH